MPKTCRNDLRLNASDVGHVIRFWSDFVCQVKSESHNYNFSLLPIFQYLTSHKAYCAT